MFQKNHLISKKLMGILQLNLKTVVSFYVFEIIAPNDQTKDR